ncbi:MAG: hypothetical protein IZT59_09340 [Verrucomicrobia bacterium]|jgi:hypothetical protein|nr:hypothetical protein [Verrucomicrobiota bacterium]|tara:strand:- start:45338 stop:45862 length:525 start_codon:yes stop_codon:yes gene_type:complete
MSSREKNLLALLLVAGFIILNFFLYTLYVQKKNLFETGFTTAKNNLQKAIVQQEMSGQLAEEIEWLSQNEPDPIAYQEVQTKLQQFAESQARNLGLTIKRQELLPTDTSGVRYNRAQVRIDLTGQEQALYRWFDAINDPTAFRSAFQIRISPNGKDDTLIDCSATLAQWFTPAT